MRRFFTLIILGLFVHNSLECSSNKLAQIAKNTGKRLSPNIKKAISVSKTAIKTGAKVGEIGLYGYGFFNKDSPINKVIQNKSENSFSATIIKDIMQRYNLNTDNIKNKATSVHNKLYDKIRKRNTPPSIEDFE